MLGVIQQKQKVAVRPFYFGLQESDCLEWSKDGRIALVTPVAVIVYVSMLIFCSFLIDIIVSLILELVC